ncbi:late competence protein ComER [Paenibacillus azoreducens]|uniref:Pyrroline-5-carboxylate reductase n=1 Tax=Paenibacillus azoreducens TaxID=116718 RepID=A0A919YDX9_9BACL|nr:late competence protein ComER [Paenibacillus azoreducens]GIO47873.1 pyrroline-5-carboxylate reductase [Paenibacillus azoreducens]
MKVGFIGTGSMGSVLLDAFITSGALLPEQIFASNRTADKVNLLAQRHPGLNVCSNNIETVSNSDIIFLCVKPLQYKVVIDEIKDKLNQDQILVSITSPVQIRHLEEALICKIAKVIPSITHLTFSGDSLCMYGTRITPKDRLLIEQLLGSISKPTEIDESYVRISSDFSSCGPAFISFFLEQWVNAAVEITGINREEITALAGEMLLGTGKLLTEGGFKPLDLQERVAVPGGITAKALSLLKQSLDGVFHQLIATTYGKYDEDLQKCDILFGDPKA